MAAMRRAGVHHEVRPDQRSSPPLGRRSSATVAVGVYRQKSCLVFFRPSWTCHNTHVYSASVEVSVSGNDAYHATLAVTGTGYSLAYAVLTLFSCGFTHWADDSSENGRRLNNGSTSRCVPLGSVVYGHQRGVAAAPRDPVAADS